MLHCVCSCTSLKQETILSIGCCTVAVRCMVPRLDLPSPSLEVVYAPVLQMTTTEASPSSPGHHHPHPHPQSRSCALLLSQYHQMRTMSNHLLHGQYWSEFRAVSLSLASGCSRNRESSSDRLARRTCLLFTVASQLEFLQYPPIRHARVSLFKNKKCDPTVPPGKFQ